MENTMVHIIIGILEGIGLVASLGIALVAGQFLYYLWCASRRMALKSRHELWLTEIIVKRDRRDQGR